MWDGNPSPDPGMTRGPLIGSQHVNRSTVSSVLLRLRVNEVCCGIEKSSQLSWLTLQNRKLRIEFKFELNEDFYMKFPFFIYDHEVTAPI